MTERNPLASGDEHIEFIDGPWADRRADLPGLPDNIGWGDGRYVRSVRCADDGAMRYVWHASPSGSSEGDT